ncbi:MAG: ABC transporter ATP-binding protein [Kiritimatiellae bacterium]|nr:ABC transporter ATP-binding protein [Kiritimatiellia bacterium]
MTESANNPNPLLQCDQVFKQYLLFSKRIEVLHGLSLNVQAGESLTIMGASGAGKSTLLHVLGGLDKPDSGQVIFNGGDIYRLSSRRRSQWLAEEVGFVFQSYHLLPELSIMENVMLPAMSRKGAVHNSARNRAHALELLERVGLAERAQHRSTELSGGEQQRASLARALMNRPSLLLADEPTGNLDSTTGALVLDYLFELKEEYEQTLIVVTHNESVAERTDRKVFLRDGVICS